MVTQENQTFEGVDVPLDGEIFKGCTFKKANLIYSGGQVPQFNKCAFEGVQWRFGDGAARTILLLSLIYNQAGEPGKELVRGVMSNIMTGKGILNPPE